MVVKMSELYHILSANITPFYVGHISLLEDGGDGLSLKPGGGLHSLCSKGCSRSWLYGSILIVKELSKTGVADGGDVYFARLKAALN